MNKLFRVLSLFFLVTFSLALSVGNATGSDSSIPAVAATAKVERLVQFLTLGTGSMTGTYFPLGKAFAGVWSSNSGKLSVMPHSTRGSIDNINLLRSGEIDLAIAQSDAVLAAVNGTGNFAGRAYEKLRVLMALFPEVVQVVTRTSDNLKTIEQLRQKRVVVGAKGSGNAITSIELMSAFGISPEEYEPVYLSYDAAIQAMERGDCDAAIIIAGIPTQVIAELQKRVSVSIMNFSSEESAGIASALPYLAQVEVASGTYAGQNESVNTLALMALLVSSDRLGNARATELCQVIFANLDYLKTIHERARDISIESSLSGIPENILHPGARAFFDRKNAEKAAYTR